VSKAYQLYSEDRGEVVCALSKKEVFFLRENMEVEIEEDQEFLLTDEDISHLILCDAKEDLIEKLKEGLGDELKGFFYYTRL
jgi:hypothetical protein